MMIKGSDAKSINERKGGYGNKFVHVRVVRAHAC